MNILVGMTTSVLFSVLMAISSIQSSGCISLDESDFDDFFYSYQTTISDSNSFELSREFDYEISEIAFESDDFILNEFSISSNILSLYLVCNTNSLMHFKLDVSFTNCRTQNETYCAYQAHNMIFISSQSDETASSLEVGYSTLNLPVGILPYKVRNNASVYVSIEGYLNTDPISGPYRSSLVQVNTSSIGSIVRGDLIPVVSIIGG